MMTVNIEEAKTHLPKLIEVVSGGKEVIIARAGRSVAQLVAIDPAKLPPRRLGGHNGRFNLDVFDAPLPGDILDAFEGR